MIFMHENKELNVMAMKNYLNDMRPCALVSQKRFIHFIFFNIPPSLLFKNLTFNPASSEKVSGWKPVR